MSAGFFLFNFFFFRSCQAVGDEKSGEGIHDDGEKDELNGESTLINER